MTKVNVQTQSVTSHTCSVMSIFSRFNITNDIRASEVNVIQPAGELQLQQSRGNDLRINIIHIIKKYTVINLQCLSLHSVRNVLNLTSAFRLQLLLFVIVVQLRHTIETVNGMY